VGASAARAAAGALRLSHSVGAAITNRRVLGRAEAGIMAGVGAALIGITAVGILWPLVLAAPIVLLGGWIGIALIVRALDLYTKKPGEEASPPEPADPPDDCDARR
jgi:cardiolipin synthase